MDYESIETVLGAESVRRLEKATQHAYVSAQEEGAHPDALAALRELLLCLLAATVTPRTSRSEAMAIATHCAERVRVIFEATQNQRNVTH